jgi:NTP pyrophosphatase (non-canonical NTP hydrolase)
MILDLTALQRDRDGWIRTNFPNDGIEDSIFGAVEEIGELAHHYLKMKQGIRGEEEEHIEGMLDSVADCVIFLAGVCTHLGADYGALVNDTWRQVRERDWVKYPRDGGKDATIGP